MAFQLQEERRKGGRDSDPPDGCLNLMMEISVNLASLPTTVFGFILINKITITTMEEENSNQLMSTQKQIPNQVDTSTEIDKIKNRIYIIYVTPIRFRPLKPYT